MISFISPPILPAVIAVPEHDELRDIWKARVASYKDVDHLSGDLSCCSSDSSASIHLFGDERDRPAKKSDGNESDGSRGRYTDAADIIAAAEVGLHNVGKKSAGTKPTAAEAMRRLAPKPKFSEWKDRIDADSHADYQLALHVEKQQKALENRLKNFRPGALVSTRNKKVSTDEYQQEGKKKGAHRDKVYGVLIKTSLINEEHWLVKFYNNKLFYCHNKVLRFEDQLADTHVLSDNQMKMMKEARFDLLAVEHENILKRVLFPLPVKLPQTSLISVASICKRLKPQHPWLEENDLRSYITAFQQKQFSSNKNKNQRLEETNKPSTVKNTSLGFSAGSNQATDSTNINRSNCTSTRKMVDASTQPRLLKTIT